MTHLRSGNAACFCTACNSKLSRRQFLCTTAATTAAAAVIGATGDAARSQQPGSAAAAGRSILIKDGCVLTLDRAVGDFERADVLVEGGKISAVQANISAPNAEVIDASRMIVMPGFVDTHRHMWQGILRNVLPDGSLDDYRAVVQRTFGANIRRTTSMPAIYSVRSAPSIAA
jgi:imidazolonepropionase-like amidohydrolase